MDLVVLTGAGRSGTTFMASLLDLAANTIGRHEFLTTRDFGYVSYYNPRHPSLRRDIASRLKEAERIANGRDVFVDANCRFTFALEPLRQARPDAKVFHLVRDGRAVVASNWVRKMYTDYSKGIAFVPNSDSDLADWENYDRFQRLAWQWNDVVSHLLARGLPIIHLEKAIADYDYLKAELLDPAGIALSRGAWEQGRTERPNGTRFKIGDFFRGRPLKLEWTNERLAQFEEICGDTMRALGYFDITAAPTADRGSMRGTGSAASARPLSEAAFVPAIAPQGAMGRS